MRLTAVTLALLSLAQTANAYRPRKPDESVLIDNMYFDPTEPGQTVIAKYVTPFDPPRTYGTICKEELEGTWEQWEGRVFLMAPGGTGKVHNELSPEFLKAAGEELDPEVDTRPGYFRAQAELALQQRSEPRELTPQEALDIYAQQLAALLGAKEGPAAALDKRWNICGPPFCPNDNACRVGDTPWLLCDSCQGGFCHGRKIFGDGVMCIRWSQC